MATIPDNTVYTKSHEYIIVENSKAKIGITDYAVDQLGDIVFVELPEIGSNFTKGEVFGTVESVKAASELYMPVSGKIAEINEALTDNPELVNEDCYNKGWFIKVEGFGTIEGMSAEEYEKYLKKED